MTDTRESGWSRRRFLGAVPLVAAAPQFVELEPRAAVAQRAARAPEAGDPGVAKLLAVVPEPVVPARPDLVAMYRKCWEIGLGKTEHGTPENGFVHWYVDAAFDRRIFQWDTCFSIAWAKYAQGALPSVESLDNFYRKQHPNGAIAGVIRKKDGTDDQGLDSPWFTRNNLFSWIEYEYYQTTGDASRFPRVIPVLVAYADWVRQNRRRANGHYYWSGWSSGMDNSPRSRADQFYPPYAWVDYDANEALAAHYLAEMARVVGDAGTEREFRRRHAEIQDLVTRDMWSEEDGFYWDLDEDGSFLKHKTVAAFWPMWARIAEPRQVDGLVRHLEDTRSFNRPHRVPTLAADHEKYKPEGGYWLGSVWAPTTHMVVKGLAAQGRQRLAREIVLNHLDNMAAVFRETGTVWENYSPERAAPGKPAKADFVGWSAVGPIAQLIEHYIGIVPDVPANTIDWTLLTTEEVGLRNLKFGDVTMELVAAARTAPGDPVRIAVHSPRAFTLRLHDGERTRDIAVPAGAQQITL